MDDRPIIIKKVKKGHGGHHGGAWKVAYADFVTAMMAFFLLLWLITMVSPEKRLAVSDYFQNYSIFKDQTSGSSSKGIFADRQSFVGQAGSSGGVGKSLDLMGKLKKAIDEKLKGYKDQIFVDVIEGGVRIQIVDVEGSVMFPSGSADLTERAKDILKIVAENINDIENRIAIEGHTDSAPFRGSQTTNWELSTSRASSARRELENAGIPPDKIARVVGYADQELFIKDNPRDPRNRRISVIVIHQKPVARGPAAKPEGPSPIQPLPGLSTPGGSAPGATSSSVPSPAPSSPAAPAAPVAGR